MVTFRNAGPMKPRPIEIDPTSEDVTKAIGRLEAWIREFGDLKEPVFIADLKTVIDAARQV